jgi:hypothetical protein
MTGLPDPLVYAFYFTPHDDRIVLLIILATGATFKSARAAVVLSAMTGFRAFTKNYDA